MTTIFWEPEKILHLTQTWNSYSRYTKDNVLVIDGRELISVRQDHGWISEHETCLEHTLLDRKSWWKHGKSIIDNHNNATHVFVGFWTIREYFPLLLYAIKRGNKVAIMHEPYSPQLSGYLHDEAKIVSLTKKLLRPLIYKFFASSINTIASGKPPCILSISNLAKQQFERAGFIEKSIFPFGYFVDRDEVRQKEIEINNTEIRLVFVGGLIKRKGLDILIKALDLIGNQSITLDIYGAGNISDFLLHEKPNITYKGVVPQSSIQEVISKYDFLVLPSRHDGWGVVVNEALLQGVPVISSNAVGSRCLIERSGGGYIFKSEDPSDLANLFLNILQNIDVLYDVKSKAKHVGDQILPSVAARYLFEAIQYHYDDLTDDRPAAIWV